MSILNDEVDLRIPWKKEGTGIRAEDGPTGPTFFSIEPCRFFVTPSGEIGMNSGRRRYFVACVDCGSIIHESTTGPRFNITSHVANRRVR